MDCNRVRNIGRNDPCWCGSQKKFKKCHLGREEQQPMSMGEIQKMLKSRTSVKECLAPSSLKSECGGKIVQAHTVSIGSSLRHIAEGGHIYGYKSDIFDFEKQNGRVVLKKMGMRQASTFNGFCSHHDKSIFSCIENQWFISSLEQCAVLAFRTVAREYYVKRASFNVIPEIMGDADKGKSLTAQLNLQVIGRSVGADLEVGTRELKEYYDQLSGLLVDKNFELLKSTIFHFDGVFPAMFAGGFAPASDIYQKPIQNLANLNVKVESIFFTAIGTETGSAIILSWFDAVNAIGQKISNQISSLEQIKIPSILMQLAVRQIENMFFSMSWCDALSPKSRARLDALIMDGVSSTPESIALDVDWSLDLPSVTKIESI